MAAKRGLSWSDADYLLYRKGHGQEGERPTTEAQFLARVMRLARESGWLCYHVPDSRGTCEGFPDLVCVHHVYGGFFAELKTQTGKRTMAQVGWGEWIAKAGWSYMLWRPSDWPEIVDVLTGKKPCK